MTARESALLFALRMLAANKNERIDVRLAAEMAAQRRERGAA